MKKADIFVKPLKRIMISIFILASVNLSLSQSLNINIDTLIINNDTIYIISERIKVDANDCMRLSYLLQNNTNKTILDTVEISSCYGYEEIYFKDYTFDSIPELVYCTNCGATGNCITPIWYWNADSSKFKLIADFDGDIDEETKTFSTWGKTGCAGMEGSGRTYKWIDNKFKTVKYIEGICSDSGQFFIEIDYVFPDCTTIYTKRIYGDEYFEKGAADPIIEVNQIYIPRLSSYFKISFDKLENNKSIYLIDNKTKRERNLTNEYFTVDSILNDTYTTLYKNLPKKKKKKCYYSGLYVVFS